MKQDCAGGCHCGGVRFRFTVEPPVELLDCNCSICSRTGFLHLIVPHSDFVLEAGSELLTSYRFGSGTAEHLFCSRCGVKSFYQPRSHPDCWSVNFHCLDAAESLPHSVRAFDGQNWESARKALN
ncbi:MAG: GFA family protein [Blastomonas sp.]